MKYCYKEETCELMRNPEIGKRVSIVKLQMLRTKKELYATKYITSPEDAADIARTLFRYSDREMVVTMSLDNKCMPIAIEVVSVGTGNTCLVGMSELFKHAILTNATNIICFHNHLSKKLEPSTNDISITNRMVKAGEILGIEVLDHIIIGLDNCFISFKELNLIK